MVVRKHPLGAAQKLGQNTVLLLIGGSIGLVVSLQYQLSLITDIAEDMQKFLPVDTPVTGEKMLVAGAGTVGVLNVEEETIMEDFLLTNDFFEAEICAMCEQLKAYIQDEAMLEEILVTGKAVSAPYMRNAIDYIKENYGDIPGYVKTELGLTDADIAKLQSLYTL